MTTSQKSNQRKESKTKIVTRVKKVNLKRLRLKLKRKLQKVSVFVQIQCLTLLIQQRKKHRSN